MVRGNWIDVDRAGLAQVIADKPREFVLFELVQNALDEQTTEVEVKIAGGPSDALTWVTVTDNSPSGYEDITHAYTMFAPSKKKGDAEKRGRFNVGCKTVLALCQRAEVVSVNAAVKFTPEGRRPSKKRREAGTQFRGLIEMTAEQARAALDRVSRMLPPEGVQIRLVDDLAADGDPVTRYVSAVAPEMTLEAVLPTVVADAQGVLRGTQRRTSVALIAPVDGDQPTLHEMGIPVVPLEGGFPWHVDVAQRVPVNTDRDNVSPTFLGKLRVAVLLAVADELTEEQARAAWVTEASGDPAAAKAMDRVLTLRFGEKRVAYDPSDPEANARAVAAGYTVVPGGALTGDQWKNARAEGALPAAGKVTPSDPLKSDPDGVPPVNPELYDEAMSTMAAFAQELYHRLYEEDLGVRWYDNAKLDCVAAFGDGQLLLNKAKMRRIIAAWPDAPDAFVRVLIHEFGHRACDNHLDERYHDELCLIGARLACEIDVNELVRRAAPL